MIRCLRLVGHVSDLFPNHVPRLPTLGISSQTRALGSMFPRSLVDGQRPQRRGIKKGMTAPDGLSHHPRLGSFLFGDKLLGCMKRPYLAQSPLHSRCTCAGSYDVIVLFLLSRFVHGHGPRWQACFLQAIHGHVLPPNTMCQQPLAVDGRQHARSGPASGCGDARASGRRSWKPSSYSFKRDSIGSCRDVFR